MLWVRVGISHTLQYVLYCRLTVGGKTGRRRALLAVICVKETRTHTYTYARHTQALAGRSKVPEGEYIRVRDRDRLYRTYLPFYTYT